MQADPGGSRSGATAQPCGARVRAVFLVVVVLCLAAPIWANSCAHRLKNNLTGQVTVDGEKKDVVTPMAFRSAPTWQSRYFAGAGNAGATRSMLLYAGAIRC